MFCCKEARRLRRIQFRTVNRLYRALRQMVAEGNEYYAAGIRDEIVIARHPLRLIHKHLEPCPRER
jgi:hypothetical protein